MPPDEIAPVRDRPAEPRIHIDEPSPRESLETVEAGPQATIVRRVEASDWHAAAPPPPPVAEESLSIPVFRPPPRLTTSFGSGPSPAGRWLAIAFLVILALAAFVMFRDVIVAALPGLAPVYAAMGLLVHPAATLHG